MRSISVTVTNAGNSNVIAMDTYISPFNVSLAGIVVSGSPTYTVQHSFDNPFATGYSAANATWFSHANLSSQTSSADGNYAFPVAAIRLSVTGTGVANLVVTQAGLVGA